MGKGIICLSCSKEWRTNEVSGPSEARFASVFFNFNCFLKNHAARQNIACGFDIHEKSKLVCKNWIDG